MLYKGIIDSLSSFLLDHPHEIDRRGFKSKLFIKSFLWRIDDRLLSSMQEWIQTKIIESLQVVEERREVLVATWLCYLPYVLPKRESIYKVPIKEANWDLVDYSLDYIDISPRWLPSSHRYRVYTLEAEGYPSWIIFMGTAYPSYPGFWSTIMADLFPGEIGWYISSWNQRKIEEWLDKHPNCKVAGMSLGARLAKQMAEHSNVKTRFLIKPALSYKGIKPSDIDRVVVMERDPVSRIGRIHDEIKLMFVSHKDVCRCKRCLFMSHAQPRLNNMDYTIRYIDGSEFNKEWPVRFQRLWYHIVRGVAFILILPIWSLSLIKGLLRDSMVACKVRLSFIN